MGLKIRIDGFKGSKNKGIHCYCLLLSSFCLPSNYSYFFVICRFLRVIKKFFFSKNSLRNTIRVSNRLDPDQVDILSA